MTFERFMDVFLLCVAHRARLSKSGGLCLCVCVCGHRGTHRHRKMMCPWVHLPMFTVYILTSQMCLWALVKTSECVYVCTCVFADHRWSASTPVSSISTAPWLIHSSVWPHVCSNRGPALSSRNTTKTNIRFLSQSSHMISPWLVCLTIYPFLKKKSLLYINNIVYFDVRPFHHL